MFTDGLMRLHQAGKVTNDAKGVFNGVSITTFALGSSELYRWLDGNDEVAFVPVQVVNDPTVIARNHSFVSINGALSVDLYGQVVADNIDGRQISGVGGHEDFVAGAEMRVDDHSLICLRSTAVANGVTRSRIVPCLPEGSVVSTPRHHTGVVITEHGRPTCPASPCASGPRRWPRSPTPTSGTGAPPGGVHPRTTLSSQWHVATRRAGSLTLATLQRPHGRRRLGPSLRHRRPSAPALDADVCVLQESWAPDDGSPSTAARVADGSGTRWWPRWPWPAAGSTRPIPRPPTAGGPPLDQVPQDRSTSTASGWSASDEPTPTGPPTGAAGASPSCPGCPSRDPEVIPLGQLRRDPARRAVIRAVVHLDGGPLVICRHPHVPHHPRVARPVPAARHQLPPVAARPPSWPGT